MREILFRGKRIDNGEWVDGAYYQQTDWYGDPCDKHNIITSMGSLCDDISLDYHEVDPKTIGQYTGLTDKNGKRIFEGDIVDILTENEEIGVVAYDDGGFLVEADGFCVDFHANINGTDLEIIGNIHDNLELVKGECT